LLPDLRDSAPAAAAEAVFEELESGVRSYCRSWPAVFATAQGSFVRTEDGRSYLDFFTGAGTLNYGHNHPVLKAAVIDYIRNDGLIHSLDMYSTAKRDFLHSFRRCILGPRQLDYTVMFPGPAGTNAVEAAIKLARKATGRDRIISFDNAFHGMTQGSMALNGIGAKAGLPAVITAGRNAPFDGQFGDGPSDERWLGDGREDVPAAVIVETVQGEGGVNVASPDWLAAISALCSAHDVLLIVDDIQAGCGRTGEFFSFEDARIVPDIVTLSKSISGYGFPMALTLLRPELDVWSPGEHSGTFRGHNPGFVTGTAALETFWSDSNLEEHTISRGRQMLTSLRAFCDGNPQLGASVRGRGMMLGIELPDAAQATAARRLAFERGLLVETCGPRDQVIKLLPPLTASDDELAEGVRILMQVLLECA
jgi:diaminobutyrate-2-oxoglutarate transaminase